MFQSLFTKYFSGNTFGEGMGFAGAKQFALTPSPGPPFLLTSANNGLSVDPISFKIVLGQSVGAVGNPALLLDTREIPTQGFDIRLNNGNNRITFDTNSPLIQVTDFGTLQFGRLNQFELILQNSAGGNVSLNSQAQPVLTLQGIGGNPLVIWDHSVANQYQIEADIATEDFRIGSTLTGTRFIINDTNQTIFAESAANRYLTIDVPSGIYAIGDLSANVNGSQLVINDSVGSFDLFAALVGPGTSVEIKGDSTIPSIVNNINGNPYLSLDTGLNVFEIGDIAAAGNDSFLKIDDGNSTNTLQTTDGAGNKSEFLQVGIGGTTVASMFTIDSGRTTLSAIDGANGIWRAFSNTNGDYIRMSDFNNRPIEAGTDDGIGGVFRYLLADVQNQLFQLGDIDAATTGTALSVNPTNSTVNYGDIFGAGNNLVSLVGSAGSEQYSVTTAGAIQVRIDPVAQVYQFGEIANNKMLSLTVSAAQHLIELGHIGQTYMQMDLLGRIIQFGDLAIANNAMFFKIDDVATTAFLGRFIGGNTTAFTLDDAAATIVVKANNGFQIGGNAAFVLRTNTTQTNQAGAQVGTLTNAPTAGNPAKWIAINDNGTIRKIPTWL